ncbi:MAG: pteridine-dependent deoxygenase [Xanthomonadales bacterium]|nr:pteridine-dependent deoxygenase [Xanthomonadales bacterium]
MSDAADPALGIRYTGDAVDRCLADDDTLAVFEFGASPLASRDPRHVPVALKQLDERGSVEVWTARGPFETGSLGPVRYARGAQLSMGHIAIDLREYEDMRAASRAAYEALQEFLGRSPHPWPLKIWNYIPGINENAEPGNEDTERYRQFCVGRAEALAAAYGDQPPMPAATGIGAPGNEPALQVYVLAGALPGMNVENPRQVNAWRYPRKYGPKSPLFSRGTVLKFNGSRQFLISGTASVVGHESQHGTARAQLAESLRNVDALLEEGRRLTGARFNAGSADGVLKVYLRDPADLEAVCSEIDSGWAAGLPRICLHGDICRVDLLTEVDGMVACHD